MSVLAHGWALARAKSVAWCGLPHLLSLVDILTGSGNIEFAKVFQFYSHRESRVMGLRWREVWLVSSSSWHVQSRHALDFVAHEDSTLAKRTVAHSVMTGGS